MLLPWSFTNKRKHKNKQTNYYAGLQASRLNPPLIQATIARHPLATTTKTSICRVLYNLHSIFIYISSIKQYEKPLEKFPSAPFLQSLTTRYEIKTPRARLGAESKYRRVWGERGQWGLCNTESFTGGKSETTARGDPRSPQGWGVDISFLHSALLTLTLEKLWPTLGCADNLKFDTCIP